MNTIIIHPNNRVARTLKHDLSAALIAPVSRWYRKPMPWWVDNFEEVGLHPVVETDEIVETEDLADELSAPENAECTVTPIGFFFSACFGLDAPVQTDDALKHLQGEHRIDRTGVFEDTGLDDIIFDNDLHGMEKDRCSNVLEDVILVDEVDNDDNALMDITFTGTNPDAPLVHSFPSQELQTPQEYLQLGIQCHEVNKLEDAAMYFKKSAKENGGCGVGMLMWGLTLRHGWGCRIDEKSGFKWLQRAAEYAVEDLESVRTGGSVDPQAIRTEELVLAIYEVGQSFFQGWGVPKDRKMAVCYYEVAARLGDPDAQNDLAFCLANGKGCKKNRKEAAKWYRAAVAQGQSDVGLAWIYKEKYQ